MKKHFLEVLMGCLLLICFYYLSREAAAVAGQMDYSRPVIVVDSGHGGDDPGMIGIGGLKEKGINLSIAMKLKEKLEEKNYKVVLTREKDAGLYEESSRNKKAQDMQKKNLYPAGSKACTVYQHPSEQLRKSRGEGTAGILL